MADSTSQKQPCTICNKATGIFRCYGCQKDFCTRHATEHRQILGKNLDEVTVQHDQLKQTINEQMNQQRIHSLMKQVDDWEIESIRKIQETADVSRKQLTKLLTTQVSTINKSLTKLSQDMAKARDDDDFVETDLKKWLDNLVQLKQELITPREVVIELDTNESLISKILIREPDHTDVFEQTTGNIRILESGKVVVNDGDNQYATVRCRNSYDKGLHRIRFKIEQLHTTVWNCFAIIHKHIAIAPQSYNAKTLHGWTAHGYVILNGTATQCSKGYQGGIQVNDVIELEIDCDKRKIRWTNERSKHTHSIDVDISVCSFPWQINLSLHYSGDRIRILQNSE